jgi:hypothetical protein
MGDHDHDVIFQKEEDIKKDIQQRVLWFTRKHSQPHPENVLWGIAHKQYPEFCTKDVFRALMLEMEEQSLVAHSLSGQEADHWMWRAVRKDGEPYYNLGYPRG